MTRTCWLPGGSPAFPAAVSEALACGCRQLSMQTDGYGCLLRNSCWGLQLLTHFTIKILLAPVCSGIKNLLIMSPWGLIFSWISCCVEWKAGQHQLANSNALCVIKMYSVNIYWVAFGTLEVEGVNKTAGTPAPSRFSFGGREEGLRWDRQSWRDWGLRGGWGSVLAKVRPRGRCVKRVRSGKRQQETQT